MVDVLMDKAKFQAYAEEIGLRVPRAVVLDEGHDERALDVLSMPVVLTPVDRALVMAGVERTTCADTVAEAPGCDGQNVRRASEQGKRGRGAGQTLRVQGSGGLPYTPNPVKVQSSFVYSGRG